VTTPPSLGVNVIYGPHSVILHITSGPPFLGDFDCDGDVERRFTGYLERGPEAVA